MFDLSSDDTERLNGSILQVVEAQPVKFQDRDYKNSNLAECKTSITQILKHFT